MSGQRAWTPVLDELTDDTGLSDGAYRLYILLASYCWNGDDTCWPSQATLARRLGVDARTVRARLVELVCRGFVVKHPRPGRPTSYELTRLVPRKAASAVPRNPASDEEHEALSRKNTERLSARQGAEVVELRRAVER